MHSRSKVDIKTTYNFKYSSHSWSGVPIMSSNMDTVTNENTATILSEYEWISVFPKHFNSAWEEGKELPAVLGRPDNYALSCGTSDADIESVMRTIKRIE